MKEQRKNKYLTMPIIFCGIILVLGFICVSLVREIARNRIIDAEIKKIEEEAKRLEAKNLEILDLVKQLEDSDFLEKEARLKLGLQKSGEQVVVINRVEQDVQVAGEGADLDPENNPVKWWYYFFRNKKTTNDNI